MIEWIIFFFSRIFLGRLRPADIRPKKVLSSALRRVRSRSILVFFSCVQVYLLGIAVLSSSWRTLSFCQNQFIAFIALGNLDQKPPTQRVSLEKKKRKNPARIGTNRHPPTHIRHRVKPIKTAAKKQKRSHQRKPHIPHLSVPSCDLFILCVTFLRGTTFSFLVCRPTPPQKKRGHDERRHFPGHLTHSVRLSLLPAVKATNYE